MKISEKIYSELYKKATTVMDKAYAPYSKFKVGAAILDSNGSLHSNILNINGLFIEDF